MPYLYYTPRSPKGEAGRNKWPAQSTWYDIPEDAVICLTEPFVKHYSGTLFSLGKPVYRADVDEHPMNAEKQSGRYQWVYGLPDNGRGVRAELPVTNVIRLPESLTGSLNILDGPCRITSMAWHPTLENEKTAGAYPVPDGAWPVRLIMSSDGKKSLFEFDSLPGDMPFTMQIENRQTSDEVWKLPRSGKKSSFDAGFLPPGFYNMSLQSENTCWVRLAFIKLFPVYVLPDGKGGLLFHKTIW